MLDRVREFIRRRLHTRSLARWDAAARDAEKLDLSLLRQMRSQARQMRRRVDLVTHIADGRLTLPRVGSNAIPKPAQSDWAYRPELWRGPISPVGLAAVENRTRIGNSATLYHDCSISELTVRQVRNTRDGDLAPFGLRMDVFKFDGSFLSLVLDLPDSAVDGLQRNHILRVETEVEIEKSLEIFARLNIKYGPNVEQVVRELPLDGREMVVEFDLAHTKISEKRLERIWMDLIFEGPEMNEIKLRDVTFSRRPRADF
ncbi:DUF6478 family protein [uncultured Litoreibacter sp.]|uniref:DUF6478 family protein n=1 Tax=uncultured Litoreibacter sp. TaxID=1392394 RepID=UPI00260B6DC8|nr:DUF6478 family protein [uncultured Litoreibacter sp.]